MKNLTVKAFVLALALVGVASTTMSSAATPAKKVVAATDPSNPAPLCYPSSGKFCGMD